MDVVANGQHHLELIELAARIGRVSCRPSFARHDVVALLPPTRLIGPLRKDKSDELL